MKLNKMCTIEELLEFRNIFFSRFLTNEPHKISETYYKYASMGNHTPLLYPVNLEMFEEIYKTVEAIELLQYMDCYDYLAHYRDDDMNNIYILAKEHISYYCIVKKARSFSLHFCVLKESEFDTYYNHNDSASIYSLLDYLGIDEEIEV